jgi:hypothetical protein
MTLKIIWVALFFSLFMYAVMLTGPAGGGNPFSFGFPDFSNPFEMAVTVAVLPPLLLAVVIPNFLIKAQKSKVTPETTIAEIYRLAHVPWVIRLALIESVTVTGFAIAVMKHNPGKIVPFLIISVIGFLLSFPSDDKVQSAYRGL